LFDSTDSVFGYLLLLYHFRLFDSTERHHQGATLGVLVSASLSEAFLLHAVKAAIRSNGAMNNIVMDSIFMVLVLGGSTITATSKITLTPRARIHELPAPVKADECKDRRSKNGDETNQHKHQQETDGNIH
jgi:phage-related tail protein